MKKQILILMSAIILITLIGNVIALDCKTLVDKSEATKQVTRTISVRAMENKTTSYNVPNYTKFKEDYLSYKTQLTDYNNLADKSKAIIPTRPLLVYNNITITKSIPRFQNKTTYSIDWLNLKITSKTIQVPLMETKTITTNQIKSGYIFSKDTGEFYRC